jgi:Cys-tRNA(Pro) deacylase
VTGSAALDNGVKTPVRSDLVGSLAVLLAAACWGTSGVFVKLIAADTDVSALSLAFWRDVASFLVLLTGTALLRPAWLRVRRADLGWLLALGGAVGFLHAIWNLGVFLNGVAVATVQMAAMPAIVAVAAWLIWRESLTWSNILAIVLTFVGTALVSGLDILGEAELSLGGLLVGLGIPGMYAAWTLIGKKVRQRHNPLTTMTYGFGFGVLVLLPFQFFTPQPWPIQPSTWLWFVGLIAIATTIPFSIYTFALGRLPASVASILAMSEIAFVAVYAYVLLGERLTASQIIGAALVVGGVLVLSWHRWQARNDKRWTMAKKKKGTAKTMPMRILDDKGIAYEPRQQARKQYTAEGVAEDLGVPVPWVVKAMILQRSDRSFVLVAIPGDLQLSLKKVGSVLGDKNVTLANQRDVQRVTGQQVGAVSVLGYRRDDIPAYLDQHVLELERAIISSGRPDMGLELDPGDLVVALGAKVDDFAT